MMEKLYKSAKTRLGADCGSDHELLIAKFRFKLKKVGKTTRPFRYDLNQIIIVTNIYSTLPAKDNTCIKTFHLHCKFLR